MLADDLKSNLFERRLLSRLLKYISEDDVLIFDNWIGFWFGFGFGLLFVKTGAREFGGISREWCDAGGEQTSSCWFFDVSGGINNLCGLRADNDPRSIMGISIEWFTGRTRVGIFLDWFFATLWTAPSFSFGNFGDFFDLSLYSGHF